jgi:hypothetical protein
VRHFIALISFQCYVFLGSGAVPIIPVAPQSLRRIFAGPLAPLCGGIVRCWTASIPPSRQMCRPASTPTSRQKLSLRSRFLIGERPYGLAVPAATCLAAPGAGGAGSWTDWAKRMSTPPKAKGRKPETAAAHASRSKMNSMGDELLRDAIYRAVRGEPSP